jgi:hypothetical protein
MAKIYRLVFNPRDQDEFDRQTLGLASIAVTLLLIVICLFVFKHLQSASKLEDCMLQGRTNCDILLARLR